MENLVSKTCPAFLLQRFPPASPAKPQEDRGNSLCKPTTMSDFLYPTFSSVSLKDLRTMIST